jgi:hypothetical protein
MIGSIIWPTAGELCVLTDDRDRGLHGAAALVSHHDDQRDSELQHTVLDAALRHRVDRVARVAHDEEFAEAAAEQELGRHARIRASYQHGERRLPARLLQSTLAALRAADRAIGDELLVALAQQLQGLFGGKAGLLRRGCLRAERCEREPGGAGTSSELEEVAPAQVPALGCGATVMGRMAGHRRSSLVGCW